MFLYLLLIIGLILLGLLYRYLPSKRIFFFFCLTLFAAGSIAFFLWPVKTPEPSVMTEEELNYQTEQQQIFATWYAGYQKDLNELDRNWQWYHNILENFKEDNISIQTTYVRLKQLEQDSQLLRNRINHKVPPLALNDGCYDLLIEVMKKTNAYADAQYRTIALTKAAADPANLRTTDQAEQSRMLQSIMIREQPVGLYTAKEIAAIRDFLDIQQDLPAKN
ncbi:MAG: hypothetical protein PUB49_11125 [Selenomonadaceae bacterium]|nr:hypothetical protein [Selenomonadaceae bacterium]